MTVSEIVKKVRELEIKSKRLTNHLFSGEYHTAFKGKGMAFKEVREYQAGDDTRFIEWNVSARMGHTYSKVFEEERELSVYFLIDISGSSFFGTALQNKKDLATEIAAVLAFSAMSNNDKVGLIFFSDRVEKYIPAKSGKDHVLFMIRTMLGFEPKSVQTDIAKALNYLNNATRQKSIVFIISDFADTGYHQPLRAAAKRHDVIGLQLFDKRDEELPRIGLIEVRDAESGKKSWLNTNDAYTRMRYHQQFQQIRNDAMITFRHAQADLMQIGIGDDYVKVLKQFFINRA
ncbi:MAG: DUF58 domain-containing protein [Bacteroidetes bacterium]|nr:DUF58 domain-containing protein [Bacteroidota bacterium]